MSPVFGKTAKTEVLSGIQLLNSIKPINVNDIQESRANISTQNQTYNKYGNLTSQNKN